MDFIDKDNLYGNPYNAFALCEYIRELELIKCLINYAEAGVEQLATNDTWSYEGICHVFAKTIVDYSKTAYDNVLLGHFHAVRMIGRSILENYVCLDIIVNNAEHELWKYYWVYSYRNIIYKQGRTPTQKEQDMLYDLYAKLNISSDFYIKQSGRKKAYIKEPYGWTYIINQDKNFYFEGICKLIDAEGDYDGFRMMSDYSHGTSFYTKMHSSVLVGDMMTMFMEMYVVLYRMVRLYCWDMVDDGFDQLAEEIEEIFYRFIDYEEELWGDM